MQSVCRRVVLLVGRNIPKNHHTIFCPLSTSTMDSLLSKPAIPEKLLLGPGPTNLSKRVTDALAWPTLGHLHPEFCKIMDDVKTGLQYTFGTKNPVTLAFSATGHSGMEGAFINLLEPGDTVLVLENGIWGQRAALMVQALGCNAQKLVNELGCAFTLEQIEKAVQQHQPTVLFVCHGESSSGVLQPMDGIGAVCRQHNVLLLVDTVASLGTAPFNMDSMQVDVVYSATQKALSAPCGLAPISFGERAWNKIQARKHPIPSFYFDINKLANYWGCFNEPRVYHHTGPIQNVYGLREALAIVVDEGIDNCIKRHQHNTQYLWNKLETMGLQLLVKNPADRNPAITTILVPDGVQWKTVVDYLMAKHKIEIAGGLGPTAGKIWRIGLMGQNSSKESVDRVVAALSEALKECK